MLEVPVKQSPTDQKREKQAGGRSTEQNRKTEGRKEGKRKAAIDSFTGGL